MKKLFLATLAILSIACSEVKFKVTDSDELASTVGQAVAFSKANPGKKVAVVLYDGIYTLEAPICLEDLGGPFRICAAPKASPLLKGDMDISGWQVSQVREGVLEARLPEGIDLGEVVGDNNRIDFYVDGERQELARWPNGKIFTHAGKCIDTEMYPGPYWDDVDYHKSGVMEYTDERIARWGEEKDPRLLGYWCWDWFESFKKLAAVDSSAHSFSVAPVKEKYGYRDGCRFYGFNLLCELDSAKEYYIDRDEYKIYWLATEGFLNDPVSTRISILNADAMIEVKGCDDVSIEGLELRGGRGTGIMVSESSRCTVKGCHIHCFAENAVDIAGGKDNAVKDCTAEQLGLGGIMASGGNRETLERSGFEVSGCNIHDFALYKHTYSPAVFFRGVGAHIHHCEMFNSSSSAMRLEGNDILVERNYIHDVVRESDDQGAIESWGSLSFRRMIIRHNRFCDINGGTFCGSGAVRFDDLISGNEVYRNSFERCGSHLFAAVQIHGGRDNRIHHNTFIDCNSSVSHTAWSWEHYQAKSQEYSYTWKGIDIGGEVYTSRYPELRIPADSLNHNINYVYHNRSIRTGDSFHPEHFVGKGNRSKGPVLCSRHRHGTRTLDAEALERNITASQTAHLENGELTGSQVIVFQDGEIVLDKCFGTKTAGGPALKGDEIYRIASMTKPVTGLALLIESDRGHLNIEDDLGQYLPEFAGRNIHLIQLVSHTSGVPEVTPGNERLVNFTLDSAVAYLAGQPLDFEPGTRTRYSTGAFDLAAKVIEKTSGMKFEDYLKANIFDKLGMDDTRFVPSEEQWERFVGIHGRDSLGRAYDVPQEPGCVFANYPATYTMAGGGLASTAADYMKFARMLLDQGTAPSGKTVIGRGPFGLYKHPAVDGSIMPGSQRWAMGIRIIVDDNYVLPKDTYGWSGYYGTHFWVDPENNIAVVYMKNSVYDGGAGCMTANELERDVMNSLK